MANLHFVLSFAHGQEPVATEQEEDSFPAIMLESVVVPLPSEVFAVLDKLGGGNWRAALSDQGPSNGRAGRLGMALQLGVVLAEGFVATHAEDAEAIEAIGKEVLRLSGALGLRSEVEAHCQAILDGASQGAWSEIRIEFDRAELRVRDAMERVEDSALAHCISIGGWVRGTEALATTIGDVYTADRAELLHQPLVSAHLLKQAQQIKESARDKNSQELLTNVVGGMEQIDALLQGEEASHLSTLQTRELKTICAQIVEQIRGEN